MQLAQRSPLPATNCPQWRWDLAEVWGIQTTAIASVSPQSLGEKLQVRSLAPELSWRQKAHLRAASHWFCHCSPDTGPQQLAQRYQEAHHHLVELQEWSIAQEILLMPLEAHPFYRQLWRWGHYREELALLSPLLPQSSGGWRCLLLYEVGQIQAVLGDHEAADQAFQQQVALARTLSLPRAIAKGYSGLGRLYSYHQAQASKARHYYQEQLRLARSCQDVLETALALDGLGRVCFLQGHWRRSTRFYRRAWKLSQTVNEPEMQQALLVRLEGSYLRWSVAGKHRRRLHQQLETAQAEGNPQQIWEAAHILASADAQARRWETALSSFEVAIAAAKAAQNLRNWSISQSAKGACYTRMKAWPQAISCTKSAISGIQQANDPVAEAICWFNLSYCYSELHQPFQALRHATQIRRLAHQTASTYIWGMLYLAVANVSQQQHRWLNGLWLAGLGIFYLGWWRSADGRLALIKMLSVLKIRKGWL